MILRGKEHKSSKEGMKSFRDNIKVLTVSDAEMEYQVDHFNGFFRKESKTES